MLDRRDNSSKALKAANVWSWRGLVSLLAATCFAWLAYTAQTHIHTTLHSAVSATVTETFQVNGWAVSQAPDNPGTDGAGDCPLCQAATAFGTLLAPLLLLLLCIETFASAASWPMPARVPCQRLDQARPTRGPPTL